MLRKLQLAFIWLWAKICSVFRWWITNPNPETHLTSKSVTFDLSNQGSTSRVRRRKASVGLYNSTPQKVARTDKSLSFSQNLTSNDSQNIFSTPTNSGIFFKPNTSFQFLTPPSGLSNESQYHTPTGVSHGSSQYFTPPSGMSNIHSSTPYFTPTGETSKPSVSLFETPTYLHGNANQSNSMTNRKRYTPDQFDGTSDWADYLKHFEAVSAWNNWTENEKAMQLTMSLRGTARQTWSDCYPGSQPSLDYDNLVSTLGMRFKPEGREEAYKAEFKSRKKLKDESFMDFGFTLRRLALRAFPKLEHTGREENVLDQFLFGLYDQNMKRHLMLSHPKNLEHAITMATEYDMVNQTLVPKPPSKPYNVAAVKEDGKAIESLMARLEKAEKALGKLTEKRGPKCYKCQTFGHIARNCPQNKDNQTQQKSTSVDASTDMSLN
jgi:hypothetical protein